jgi:hypothetical protein
MIHARLAKFRVNRGREFFHLPIQDAIRELTEIADALGRPDPNLANPTPLVEEEAITSAGVPSADLAEDEFPLPNLPAARQATVSSKTPTENEHINALPPDLQRVYLEMRKRALAFGPHVEVYTTRKNLVFKAGKMFAEIQRKKGCLRVLIRPEGFNIPENTSARVHGVTVTRVPDKYRWTVNHKLEVDGTSPMDGMDKLLRQSYDAVVAGG